MQHLDDSAWRAAKSSNDLVPTAFKRGITRTIRNSLKRYLSILIITALGVTIMIGLSAGCRDLRESVDAYFDAQHVYDISVQSTLGLTADDVDAVAELEGVDTVEGIYSESAYTAVGSKTERVNVQSLSTNNMDQPVVLEGELPESSDEVAVTAKFLEASGKHLGDTVQFAASRDRLGAEADTSANGSTADSDATEVFATHAYTICAVVEDPTDIMADTTANSFRATTASSFAFYVDESAATSSAFTAIHVLVDGAADVQCYSDAYTKRIDAVKRRIQDIADEREQAREEELTSETSAYLDQMERGTSLARTLKEQSASRTGTRDEKGLQQLEDADAQIADARAQVEQIGDATWYIQDRTSISSYASVDSDSSSIEALASVIPLIFFVVAVLISLTTATRMVEEERTLIGLYKALGYSRSRILSKYIDYTLSACLLGGLLGCILGFIALPKFLFLVFESMYSLPDMLLGLDIPSAFVAIGLFAVGIVGATWIAVRREVAETPAALMRPRAPRAGSRIFLERIRPLWRHMGFLNKVAARNLFRYKKRAFMTIFGVAGCCALIICGMGIRDTVESLCNKQYGQVTRYDLLAVSTSDELDELQGKLDDRSSASDGAKVEKKLPLYTDNVTLSYGGKKETVQLIVVPRGSESALDAYVRLADEHGGAIGLSDLSSNGIVITKSASMVLGASDSDTLSAQDSAFNTAKLQIDHTSMAYLGNAVYMTQDAFEQAFGCTFKANALMVDLSGTDEQQISFCDAIEDDGWLTTMCTAQNVRDFEKNFSLINAVVVLVVAMAACLSFVVVFTLCNTNISERERELATIKVLGFRSQEVHHYVNKETMILTAIGAVVGIPLGYALARSFTYILQMPSLYFDVQVEPLSYALAVVLSFVFTIIVMHVTNRSLDRVDMVGALKSAE